MLNMVKANISSKENKITLFVDPKIYSLEAILGACYVFIDRAYVFLDEDRKKKIKIFFKSKKKVPLRELNKLAGEFQNELLNYSLRSVINKSNRKIREYIVGSALFSANSDLLLEDDRKGVDYKYQEDPLGIAIPWEEKFNEGHDKNKVK